MSEREPELVDDEQMYLAAGLDWLLREVTARRALVSYAICYSQLILLFVVAKHWQLCKISLNHNEYWRYRAHWELLSTTHNSKLEHTLLTYLLGRYQLEQCGYVQRFSVFLITGNMITLWYFSQLSKDTFITPSDLLILVYTLNICLCSNFSLLIIMLPSQCAWNVV